MSCNLFRHQIHEHTSLISVWEHSKVSTTWLNVMPADPAPSSANTALIASLSTIVVILLIVVIVGGAFMYSRKKWIFDDRYLYATVIRRISTFPCN